MTTSPSLLSQLGLTPAQVPELKANDRSRLLNFLLRWEATSDLHACLDILLPRQPTQVSLLDLRVRALLAEGRPAEALSVMQQRLALKDSATAQVLLGEIYLAQGDVAAAHRLTRTLAVEAATTALIWPFVGTVELARGDLEAALAAYRRLDALRPQSRAYLLGMMEVYAARRDWVSASAYAVRLLRSAEATAGVEDEEASTLPVAYLRRLQAYFTASGETTRVADIAAELAQRLASELRSFQQLLAGTHPAPAPSPAPGQPAMAAPAAALPVADTITVTPEERSRITAALRQQFGFTTLLPGQLEALAVALRGEDLLVVLPTGGGKSLCYQLPAFLATQGVTLVISPLIALMKDQVDSLPPALRRQTVAINSSLEGDELRRRLEQVAAGEHRLVYAAPERLRQPPFLHLLRRVGVNRLVVDEAHCVSIWGHDFRPDYLLIGRAREVLGRPPLLALTATAPARIRRDILERLGPLRIVATEPTRPNLRLEVFFARHADDKLRRLLAFCQAERGSGIIYAGTRERCEELAALLRRQGQNAAAYHAGLPDRARVQDDFMAGRTRLVVATVAFGLGIDKPDIRFIVHFVPPDSLEAYAQEAGRAGRDGQPARCLLMYASSDRATLTRHAQEALVPVEFLRTLYAALKRRFAGENTGQVPADEMERDTGADDIQLRVALSLLEEAGLLHRGPDVPHSVSARLPRRRDETPEGFAAFCNAARLHTGEYLTCTLPPLARQLNLTPDELEYRLLAWADAGLLEYRPSGRDLALALLPAPPDAADRVARLLERYAAIQTQRVDELAAYAQTGRCRHGYLNAYLGGHPVERCRACDNCLPAAPPPEISLPDEAEQRRTVLQALAGTHGWGRQTLIQLLRGDTQTPPQARTVPGFGALAFRSESAIASLLKALESEGLLQGRLLDHGGIVLELTAAGRAALPETPGASTHPGVKGKR